MPDPALPDPPRRTPRTAATLAGLLVLAAGCSTTPSYPGAPGAHTPASTSTPPAPAASSPTATATPAPGPDSPVSAARNWLVAYHSATWTDASPAAWIDRVQPYVTDTLHASNETLRSGGGGADWTEFVRQHCTNTVTDTDAVIPPESPGTTTTANVQVTGTIHTTCTAGTPLHPTEQVSATLVVIKSPTGWRVDQRLF